MILMAMTLSEQMQMIVAQLMNDDATKDFVIHKIAPIKIQMVIRQKITSACRP
jgi:hypothetical protein